MAYVELISEKGSIQAKIGDDILHFKSSGAESETGHWPIEYLLAALGSCFSGTAFAYAKTKNFPLEKVIARIKGEVISSPSRIKSIEMEVEFKGNLTTQEKERLLKAAERACTIMNTLKNGVEEIQTKISW